MIALLFPGQGSQQPGMGKFLVENFPIAKRTFEEASDAIGLNMKRLCFEADVAELTLTENTQPALLTVGTATERVLREDFGVKGAITAGHSIGEYGSFVAAGVLGFSDAVRSVRKRGQAMQAAVPVGQGGMVAVMGLDEVQVTLLCMHVEEKSGHKPLSPANFNSPGQIVISGSALAIEWMKTNFKAEKLWPENTPRVKLIPLTVSAPFHCAMMKPAEEEMRDFLGQFTFENARLPIIQNLDAQSHTSNLELKENLIRQISGPVRWMQSMETLKKTGTNKVIELGAGKVLQGLLKKIDSEFFQVFNTNTLDELKAIQQIR